METEVWFLVADRSETLIRQELKLEFWSSTFRRLQKMYWKAASVANDAEFISKDIQFGKYSRWAMKILSAQWIMSFIVSLGTLAHMDEEAIFAEIHIPVSLRIQDATALSRVLSASSSMLPSRAMPQEAFASGCDGIPLSLQELVFWAEKFTCEDIFGLIWQVQNPPADQKSLLISRISQ